MKVVVLQADGMADEPIGDLGARTPLECARTPTLDQMASRGILGLSRTIPRGLAPGREVGTLSVLGYDPKRYPTSAATLEAACLGVQLGPEDVAFRLYLVTLETPEGGVEAMRDFAAGHPSNEEGRALVTDLGRELGRDGVEFHPGLGYRHLLVWRKGEHRMRTVPPHAVSDKPVGGALPEGPGADVLRDLMERSRAVIAAHPVCQARRVRGERTPTAVWLWGQGRRSVLPTLNERFGVTGAVVAAVPLANGLGVLAGLRRVAVPGATGYFDTDLRAKVEHGLQALDDGDLLFLHVEAPDEAGHMGDPQRKIEAIEQLDAQMIAPLLEGLRQKAGEWRVLVMPGNATPCASKTHSAEPVPFVVYVSGDEAKARGQTRGYSERDARDNGIFIPEAHTLAERLLRR
jgi:2,3-bisphosphoglycerate-independent phosphoglycerate mutase